MESWNGAGCIPLNCGSGRYGWSANRDDTTSAEEVAALRREGIDVTRGTVERLMRELGLHCARRGNKQRTTIVDPAAGRPADLVQRRFTRVGQPGAAARWGI